MNKQPEALRLAELMDAEQVRTVHIDVMHCEAAAELRRLHEVNAELVKALKESTRLVDDALASFGDCDHEVGICNCDMKKSIKKSNEALANDELVWALGTPHNNVMRESSANDPYAAARRAITRAAAEIGKGMECSKKP